MASERFRKGERFVAIAPGASHSAKRWPAERFLAVAHTFALWGVRSVFVLGPKERAIRDEIRAGRPERTPVLEGLPLPVLAGVLARARAFVGNDAGILHLARAVGTKSVGVFGPGIPEVWFPDRSDGHDALVHLELDCSRCGHDRCPGLGWRCMLEIAPEDVARRVERLLA